MPNLIKILIVWLCALSFPLQGLAAVSMASCGSVHQHQMSKRLAPSAQDVEPGVTHADGGHHHDADHSTQASAHASADKCSVCASCCANVAMVAPVVRWLAASQLPAALVVKPSVGRPSFHPDGLDRPPRSSLA